jgi:K319-like protein
MLGKVMLKVAGFISILILLATTTTSSLILMNPLAEGQNELSQLSISTLTHFIGNNNSSLDGSWQKIPTNTTAIGFSSIPALPNPFNHIQFLGQTYTMGLHSLAAGLVQQHQSAVLFHHRDPSSFAFAKSHALSIISHVKVLTRDQQLLGQRDNLLQQAITQTLPAYSFSTSIDGGTPSPSLQSQPSSSEVPLAGAFTSTSASPSIGKVIPGFDGLTKSQAGFNGNTFFPPDVPLAVGPTHVVQLVNLAGEIFTKRGVSVSTFSLPTFFKVSGTNDKLSDPRILYDSLSGRWFASLGDGTTNNVFLAVSTTNDPTRTWNIYQFGFSNCPDEPGIGMNDDKFAISANLFSSTCNGPFTGVQYYIVNKSDLINGLANPHFVVSSPNASLFSVYPVQSLSSTSTLYMVSVGDDQSNSISLYSFTGTVSSNNNNLVLKIVSLPIQTTHIPPDALQPGTTTKLDTGDARVENAVWYQGKMWVGFNDACTPPGDMLTRACIRFDKIDANTNTVLQDFDRGDIGVYYFYPGLQIDGNGNLDYIYGYSSTSTFPSLAASGQAVGSTSNTFLKPITLKLGTAADASGRYGDYFEGAVDPSNTSIVWVAGEYHSSSDWSTFISAIDQLPGTSTTIIPSHTTSIILNPLSTSTVAWATPVTVTGKLTDDNASGIGIGGKTITFTGTGAASITSTVTNPDGTFSMKGTAPSNVAPGWTIQANFGGDGTYKSARSNIQVYSTTLHSTYLTLIISPNSVGPLGSFSVSGSLMDTSASNQLEGKEITFTATSPIIINSIATNSKGQYAIAGLSAPNTTAVYSIQAHFDRDSLYNLADSGVKTLTVTTNSNGGPTSHPPHPLQRPPISLPLFPPITKPSSILNLSRYIQMHIFQQTQALLQYLQNLRLQEQQQLHQQLQLQQWHYGGRYNITTTGANVGEPLDRSSSSSQSLQQIQQAPLSAQLLQHQLMQHAVQSQFNPQTQAQNIVPPYVHIYPNPLSSSVQSRQYSPLYQYHGQAQFLRLMQPQNPISNQQTPPIANAGLSQTVYGGTVVTLDGRASYDLDNMVGMNNNGIAAYQWTQVQIPSNTGLQTPIVSLQGTNTATPTFTAPLVKIDTVLGFSLRVIDNHGAVSNNQAVVYVVVKHNPYNIGPTTGSSGNAPVPNANQLQQPQLQQQSQQPQRLPQSIISNNLLPAQLPQLGSFRT